MSKKKKKRPLPPRRKRMNREGRLQSARVWLSTYNGNNVLRSYRKWYGVDWICAIKEMQILGVKLDEKYIENLKNTVAQAKRKRHVKKDIAEESLWDSDENFEFIIGYTSGGAPYGVPWGEIEEI